MSVHIDEVGRLVQVSVDLLLSTKVSGVPGGRVPIDVTASRHAIDETMPRLVASVSVGRDSVGFDDEKAVVIEVIAVEDMEVGGGESGEGRENDEREAAQEMHDGERAIWLASLCERSIVEPILPGAAGSLRWG